MSNRKNIIRKLKKKLKRSSRRELREFLMNKENPKIIEVLLSKERTLLSKKRVELSYLSINIAVVALGLGVLRIFENSEMKFLMWLGPFLVILAIILSYKPIRNLKNFGKGLSKIRRKRGLLHKLYYQERIKDEFD